MNYRGAVLLDLDGTLVDSALDFVHVIQSMQAEDNIPPTSAESIRNTVSDGARALTQLAYGYDIGSSEHSEKLHELLDRYEAELGKNAQVFAGFFPMLEQLEQQGIAWGIVTNKPWRFTEPLIKRLQLQPSANVIVCPDHVKNSKPAPEPLYLAAEQLQLKPEQCLYAGDHIRDIQAAHNANIPSIACAYGYIKESDDINAWKAKYIINEPKDLETIAKEFYQL